MDWKGTDDDFPTNDDLKRITGVTAGTDEAEKEKVRSAIKYRTDEFILVFLISPTSD